MTARRTLLVLDDDRLLCRAIHDLFSSDTLEVTVAHSAAEGLSACEARAIDVVVLDERLPDGVGHTLCSRILALHGDAKIIFVTAYPSFDHAVQALQAGAHDYLAKPFELEALGLSLRRCGEALDLERAGRREAYRSAREEERSVIVGGVRMEPVRATVRLAAEGGSTVLVTGETGTGKNVVARAIHFAGPRRTGPFVSLNCAALPEHLVEAEILGWERGAFTGAIAAREGVVEMADGGTLLLDEIGELPMQTQAKLLDVIEERSVRRLGGRTGRRIDARLVAATNADLDERVAEGRFRADLFYRLDVVRIHVPPLRERAEDLPALCAQLLRTLGGPRSEASLADGEIERLAAYRWPGNVRELRNVLERALVLHRGSLRPSELLGAPAPPAHPSARSAPGGPADGATLETVERRHIEAVLRQEGGNLARTARALRISLSTLKRKLRQFRAA